MKSKRKKINGWKGTRWMIVSPWQKYESTLAIQRQGAWLNFKYFVFDDIEARKKQGTRAVKLVVTFRPAP